jgi:cytoskeleton protein RodZ
MVATSTTADAAVNAARRDASADAAAAPAKPTRLRLELANESWVEVYDARNQRLFYDVASAGSVQSIEGRPPLRVVLGNAAAVSVQVDGQPREIPAGAVEGEGARFVVNRSGTLARSRQ